MRCTITGEELTEYVTIEDAKGNKAYASIDTLYDRLCLRRIDPRNLSLALDFDTQLTIHDNYKNISPDNQSALNKIKEKFNPNEVEEELEKPADPTVSLLGTSAPVKAESTCVTIAKFAAAEVGSLFFLATTSGLGYITQKQNGFDGFEKGLDRNVTLDNPDYRLNPETTLIGGLSANTFFAWLAIQALVFQALRTTRAALFFALGILVAALTVALNGAGTYVLGDRQSNVGEFRGSLHHASPTNASNPFSFHATRNDYIHNGIGQSAIIAATTAIACGLAFYAGVKLGYQLFRNRDRELEHTSGSAYTAKP